MKKVFLVLAVASVSLVACKKKFSCECSNGFKIESDEKGTKDEREEACNVLAASQSAISTSIVTCEVK